MNTEKNQIENEAQQKSSNESTNEARRSFLKIGAIAAPVIMSLASKPVFAFQALSNMLSGNTSANHNQAVSNARVGGMSPTFWKDPANISFWTMAGLSYGIVNPLCATIGSTDSMVVAAADDMVMTDFVPTDMILANFAPCNLNALTWQDYTGGTTVFAVLGISLTSSLEAGQPMSLREFLNTDNTDNLHFAAGYLNALYYQALAGTGETTYMFTPHQFDLMYTNQTVNGVAYSKTFLLSLLNGAHYTS